MEQGSLEWVRVRLGMPTASNFDSLVTPKSKKPSASADRYLREILAEWTLGHPLEWGSSGWTERGTEMEAEARRWYEFDREVEVREVGFVMRDDGLVGGSPDGLVGDDGGLEIKCPAAHTHVGYVLQPDALVASYVGQVQGLLYLTGRGWWHMLSYCPGFPEVVVRVEPDPEYHEALEGVLEGFLGRVEKGKARLREYRQDPMASTEEDWP